MGLAARPAGCTEPSAASSRFLVPSCSRPSRTSLTVALRAILDCRCARQPSDRAGRDGRMALGAEPENWAEEDRQVRSRDAVARRGRAKWALDIWPLI